MAAANPFFIDPTAGRTATGLSSLGEVLGERREKQAQKERGAIAQEEITAAIESGDPDQVQKAMGKYPELSNLTKERFGITSDKTRGMVDSVTANVLQAETPEAAADMIDEYLPQISQSGGQPFNLALAAKGLREGTQTLEQVKGVAMLLNPEMAKRHKGQTAAAKPTANIQDFNHYKALAQKDPEAAAKFAQLTGISGKNVPEAKPTTAMQNFDKWAAMGEGEEKKAFGRVIGISPKETEKSAQAKMERVDAKKAEIRNAQSTLNKVDEFISNDDFVESISGFSGRLPTITTGATDAEAMFDSLKDSLTLENLEKMSGPLTDSDIKILASAASSLRYGISKGAMLKELNKIKNLMTSKIERAREGVPIESLSGGDDEVDIDDLPATGGPELSDSAKKYLGQ